ncbi:type II toxin-antitoxin system RelE/ParE family toxin [Desulfovibrio sp. JC010]|uniref:type II toxin-antitoxin system RelE family toxin n=1 Tax=Desulfovibrio sp. JC010 TaxID=2593641 RepID=UPI0013D482E0|nr:type II toxin-antitoxin system RelE/ParE family toxin [Desulfovibrio sp. JC010]NDV27088.1 type II toxin-antitoxin system RelE/ParE family toxin [Desulfovibrio sp. JC010]
MAWKVEYTARAKKSLRKLDKQTALRIVDYMDNLPENPRDQGKGLVGNLAGYWRYRVGNYRVLTKLEDEKLLVLVVEAGHRRNIYGGH